MQIDVNKMPMELAALLALVSDPIHGYVTTFYQHNPQIAAIATLVLMVLMKLAPSPVVPTAPKA